MLLFKPRAYLKRRDHYKGVHKDLCRSRQGCIAMNQPGRRNSCQSTESKGTMVELDSSCVLKGISPPRHCPVFLWYKPPMHEGKRVVSMSGIHTGHKSPCRRSLI